MPRATDAEALAPGEQTTCWSARSRAIASRRSISLKRPDRFFVLSVSFLARPVARLAPRQRQQLAP
jgi:hypothetical protein